MVQMQNMTNQSGKCIDITHAVSSKFNMAQMPVSPMATPVTTVQAADYFSVTVYAKAVVARDHEAALKSSMPTSPYPAVPPQSVKVSLMERFIPPSQSMEAIDSFSTEGPSVLVDRLVELSPDGGTLIFVYPTKAGAQTFASRYLAPIVDPIIRNMTLTHGLSFDIGKYLGEMSSVSVMLPFDQMHRKVNNILHRLSRAASNTHRATPKYTLVHSSSRGVDLDHSSWVDWWIMQESERIRAFFDRYYAHGQRLPVDPNITAGYLHRKIVDGVRTGGYPESAAPRNGIEVGVFVIKSTA